MHMFIAALLSGSLCCVWQSLQIQPGQVETRKNAAGPT